MGNKYYKSFKSFYESVSSDIVDKAKEDEKRRQENIDSFSKQYNKEILRQARKSINDGTWDKVKDKLYIEVLKLLKTKGISDLNVFNKNINNKKDKAHNYFLSKLKQDSEAKKIADENLKKKNDEINSLKVAKEKADSEEKEDNKEDNKEDSSQINLSVESKSIINKIKTENKTIQLSIDLVNKVLPEVKLVQEIFNSKGATLKVDGRFGKNTKSYTIKYQNLNNLNPTGIIDNDTWKSLLSIDNDLKIIKPKHKTENPSNNNPSNNTTSNDDSDKNVKTTTKFDNIKIGDKGKVNLNDISFNITESIINESDNYLTELEKEEKEKVELLKSISGIYDYEIKDNNIISIKSGDVSKDFKYTLKDGKININITTEEIKSLKKDLAYKMILKNYSNISEEKIEKMKDGTSRDYISFNSSNYGQIRFYKDNTFRQVLNGKVNFEGSYYFSNDNKLKLKWKDTISKSNASKRKQFIKGNSNSDILDSYNVKDFIGLCLDEWSDNDDLIAMENSEDGVITLSDNGYKDIYGFYHYYSTDTFTNFDEDTWKKIFNNCSDVLLYGFIYKYNNELHHFKDSKINFDFITDSQSAFSSSEMNQIRDIIRTKGMVIDDTKITKA